MPSNRLLRIGRVVVNDNATSKDLAAARAEMAKLSQAERAQLHRVAIQAGYVAPDRSQADSIKAMDIRLGKMQERAHAAESAGFPASKVKKLGGIIVPKGFEPKKTKPMHKKLKISHLSNN